MTISEPNADMELRMRVGLWMAGVTLGREFSFKPDDLRSISETHVVNERTGACESPLISTCVPWHARPYASQSNTMK